MSWDQLAKGKTVSREAFFKSISDIKHIGGLKVGIYGPPESGKTYFAMTFPPPIYVIDTEFGAHKVAKQHFENKEIFIFEATQIDLLTDRPDPLKSIEEVENALTALKDIKEGTIVIDSGTDIWQWIGAWLEQVASRRAKDGRPYQFEWGTANERYRHLIMRLLSKPVNLVITAQEQIVYDQQGRPTSMVQPRWQKQTPHWVDVLIHLEKRFDPALKKWRYIATIEKCRFARAYQKEIEDIDYKKLIDTLRKDLGVKLVG